MPHIRFERLFVTVRGRDVEYARAVAQALGPELARLENDFRQGLSQSMSVERVDVPNVAMGAGDDASAVSRRVASAVLREVRGEIPIEGATRS